VEEGRSIRHLVPDTVAAYMTKNRLYQRALPNRTPSPGDLDIHGGVLR